MALMQYSVSSHMTGTIGGSGIGLPDSITGRPMKIESRASSRSQRPATNEGRHGGCIITSGSIFTTKSRGDIARKVFDRLGLGVIASVNQILKRKQVESDWLIAKFEARIN